VQRNYVITVTRELYENAGCAYNADQKVYVYVIWQTQVYDRKENP